MSVPVPRPGSRHARDCVFPAGREQAIASRTRETVDDLRCSDRQPARSVSLHITSTKCSTESTFHEINTTVSTLLPSRSERNGKTNPPGSIACINSTNVQVRHFAEMTRRSKRWHKEMLSYSRRCSKTPENLPTASIELLQRETSA